MKILITTAVLLNVYGVLSEPHIFQNHDSYQKLSDPHPRRHHEHHRQHHSEGSVLTTDDLADVLLSLPGSLGKEAYKTFLALGRFLPADTKAHTFFTSIPKAIRRKSNDPFAAAPAMPTMPSAQFSPNSMFMMQPAGYHMVPLPLHPMFSSSPLDYLTRVPCRHTKVIRVPLHTFDVQISAVTRKFSPSQSLFDESDDDGDGDDDDDDDDDDMNSGLKDLLDLISSDTDVANDHDADEGSEGKKSPEEVDSGISQPDNKTPDSHSGDDSNRTEPSAESAEEKPEIQAEYSADESLAKEAEAPAEEKSVSEMEDAPAAEEDPARVEAAPAAEPVDESAPALTPVSEPTDSSAPAQPEPVQEPETKVEEVEQAKQEASELINNLSQEDVESKPAAPGKPDKKKKKKPSPKKGKKAAAEADIKPLETEPELASASQLELDDDLMEEVSKPIPTKKGKKKTPKQQ